MQNGNAEAAVYNSKKLEDAMHETGLKLKHHEENIIFLKAQKNGLDNSILDMQVAFGKYHTAGKSGSENEELSHVRSEEETIEHILKHEKSAAGIWCQLKTHHGTQASHLPMMKDILGVVAMLGNVDDDNLNRLLSDYLGLETMLAIVCKTYDSIKSLETYDKEGHVNKTLGLHGLGASIQRPLDGRFLVICLEKLRPYPDDFIDDDPQRRLDIPKPRLPNGESPPGFLGFAVNMVNIDSVNLYCATSTGYGLRETLFYSLFSRLHVYKTREDMLQALPCIRHGAISLDGGMIKHNGLFSLGKREIDVKFPKSSGRSSLPQNYFEMERQIKEMKWKKERAVEDMQREQALLDHARFNFDIKKQEYLKFLAQSSSYATQPDSEFVNNSLLATQSGDFEGEYSNLEATRNKLPGNSFQNSRQGDGNLNSCLPKETGDAARVKRQQSSKMDGGNSSSVHPVKGCEDENFDYDSTSSFEFHKGERSMHHNSITARSFSRPMSSKWDDAEKWIMNRQNVQANHSKKDQLQNQAYRGPASSMIAPEKFDFDQPGSQSRGNGLNALSLDLFPESKDLTEVISGDSSCTKSLTEDRTVGPAIRSVSMRDMGTEMTPIPSQGPSRTATPVGATTPLRSPTSSIPSTPRRGEPALTTTENYIDNASQTSTENNKRELSEEELKVKTRKEIVALGVQLGKMNIAAWASKYEKDKSNGAAAEAERMEYARRAAAWEEAEKSKHTARYKREEIKIQAWESQEKAKLEAELRKIEAQVEQMRAQAQAKMVKKIAMARQKSEEKRAAAEARRNQQAEKTTEHVQYLRQTGRLPSSSFTCCGWL